jgi:hypothetical protein
VRKAHNSGRNHLANVRDYYASLGHDKAQNIIDQITAAYESGGGPPPGGFGFGPQSLGGPMPPFGNPMANAPFARPPFPPGPGFGGMPPFPPPNGMNGMPPPLPPFPPGANGAPGGPPPMGGGFPPFPPHGAFPPGGPPNGMALPGGPPGPPNGSFPPGPPGGGPPSNSGPPSGGAPAIHPDRLRMMGSGGP